MTAHLTAGAATGNFPVWSPDGTRMAFGSNRDASTTSHHGIERCIAGRGASEEPRNKFVLDWSSDGRCLGYGETVTGGTEGDLWISR